MYLGKEMYIMKIYLLLSVLLVSTNYSYAKHKIAKNSVKGLIVREIMNKVSNLTLRSLTKVSDEKKEVVLHKIESKLKNTAKHLADGDKYVKMIMQEFRDKAYTKNEKKDDPTDNENNEAENNAKEEDDHEKSENDITINKHDNNEMKDSIKKLKSQVATKTVVDKSSNSSSNRKVFDPLTKKHIIKDIAHKIESMAKSYIKDSQTLEQKQAILKKIEGRILESSKRKHLEIHNQHKDLKAYTDLITQGLELSMKRLLKSNSRRTGNMEAEEAEIENKIGMNETRGLNMKHINRYKAFFSDILSETSIDPHCADIVERICLRIHSLYNLPCGDGKIIALDQLCDGVFDCWNEADETNCTSKVIDKLQRSSTLMKDVEQSITTKCLHPLVGGPIFTHHHAVLSNMLKSQLDNLENHEAFNMTVGEEAFFRKKKIGDATTIVSSLSTALEINLCASNNRAENHNTLTRRSMNIDANGTISVWSPKSCTCERDVCKIDNCDARCKRICWQKFRLNRWRCQTVAGAASVPLDLICDGKLDCFDESDELLCAMGSTKNKYEANNLFNELLDIVTLKSISTEYEHSRNKLMTLAGLIREMQKFSTNYNVDLHAIKTTRDDYFKMLVHVYTDAMRTSNLEELDRTHDFLVLLNEKMVQVMKISHTGNENVIPSAGCFCRNGTCALVRCSQKCIDTCLIEPTLTKYSCNVNNLTVSIKNVCNGKKDCPNGLDEEDCKKEVCRTHHLILLRNALQNAGPSLQGTLIGDALKNWKAKVIASLRIAEKGERPSHKTLEETVVNILHDLVSTYASMEETRKNNAQRVTEFINMSNIVKTALKSCGN